MTGIQGFVRTSHNVNFNKSEDMYIDDELLKTVFNYDDDCVDNVYNV